MRGADIDVSVLQRNIGGNANSASRASHRPGVDKYCAMLSDYEDKNIPADLPCHCEGRKSLSI
jgi:hypothetical protein